MPNPWDVGSAKLLSSAGFEALATTSAGFAWALGKHDQQVTRDELIAHVAALAEATDLPLNVDSERCYPDDPGGIAETVALLADAGAAGFSIEDYDPAADGIDDIELASDASSSRRRGLPDAARAAGAHRQGGEPHPRRRRPRRHDRAADRLSRRRADAVYAPGLTDLDQIAAVVRAVGVPVNVLALPRGPTFAELASVGVRRVSVGSLLAGAAYGALMAGARELQDQGTSLYAESMVSRAALKDAFGD